MRRSHFSLSRQRLFEMWVRADEFLYLKVEPVTEHNAHATVLLNGSQRE